MAPKPSISLKLDLSEINEYDIDEYYNDELSIGELMPDNNKKAQQKLIEFMTNAANKY